MKLSLKRGLGASGVIFCAFFTFAAVTCAEGYGGGSGTPEDPYQIWTAEQMNSIGANSDDWSKSFILMTDIDLAGYDGKDDRPSFNRIAQDTQPLQNGFQGVSFTGTFDGNNHRIYSFTFDNQSTDYVGLFGSIGFGGHIVGILLDNVNLRGRNYVGGVVAYNNQLGNTEETIKSCVVSGIVKGTTYVGGLIGLNEGGTISFNSMAGTVRGTSYVGGFVGENINGIITQSSSTGSVIGGGDYIGGLIGKSTDGTISFGKSSCTISGSEKIGGIVGHAAYGSISCCQFLGDISGVEWVGGIGGRMYKVDMNECSSSGTVTGPGDWIGGLGGDYSGSMTSSFSTAKVSGRDYAGGVVGQGSGTFENCSSTGDVSGRMNVGGLSGGLSATLSNCYSTGHIRGEGYTGGFAGKLNMGSILQCRSEGSVEGTYYCGGFVGYMRRGTISESTSIGNITGTGSVGGLVGWIEAGDILNCYSTGYVTGTKEAIGGLIGRLGGSLSNCYSAGTISGSVSVGGLVGISSGVVFHSFWDLEHSGQTSSAGGEGKTTAQMKEIDTFSDWGYCPKWKIQDGIDSPRLLWEQCDGIPIFTLPPWNGSGTENDPFQIATAAELDSVGKIPCLWDKSFILTGSIDLSEYGNQEGGPIFHIIAPDIDPIQSGFQGPSFTGTFNGNGFTISGFSYRNSMVDYVGLFGCLGQGGIVMGVGLLDAYVEGKSNVGGLAGWNNSGTLINCFSSGSYSGGLCGGLVGLHSGLISDCYSAGQISSTDYQIGGLVGAIVNGTISNSFSTTSASGNSRIGGLAGYLGVGTVLRSFSTGTISGGMNLGGLIGEIEDGSVLSCFSTSKVQGGVNAGGLGGCNRHGTLSNCYSLGDISGSSNAGGLLGINESGTITNCYSIGQVAGTPYLSGLVGGPFDTGNVFRSFWDLETSAQSTSMGGIGKTTAEMKTKGTFTDAVWDFVGEAANGTADVWRTCADGVSYPRLSWEFSQGGDMDCPDGVGMEDLVYLAGRWMASTPATVGAADANADGRADLIDLAILSENWGYE